MTPSPLTAATARLDVWFRLARLDRPIGILLLLWPTLWGLWLAGEGRPDPRVVLIFIAGVVLMRSAGCVINDFADRRFDPHVQRTRARPLATGEASAREALLLAGVLSLLAFLLVLPLNALVLWLSLPALLLAAGYPFSKRYIHLPQAVLGLAFGFSIPMAFAALTGGVPAIAWLLLFANLFWTIAYDTEYAMVDRPDDLKIGVRSAAILFGRFDVPAIMACYGLALLLLGVVGWFAGLGAAYLLGLLAAAAVVLHHWRLIRHRQPGDCFRAFLHNNWFGCAVFLGLVADHALQHPLRAAVVAALP